MLLRAGVPAPVVAAATADFLLVLRELAGRPLAHAIFDEPMPCTAENLIMLLDSMPAAVAALPRRPPWTDAVATYAEIIRAALPSADPQLRWLTDQITGGLAGLEPGREPTHGDFHEGQLFVARGVITGLADIDTIGPGRRADDLACLIAHLSTVQRMTTEQAAGLTRLIRSVDAGLRHPGRPSRAAAPGGRGDRLAGHRTASGPGAALGARDGPDARFGRRPGAERGSLIRLGSAIARRSSSESWIPGVKPPHRAGMYDEVVRRASIVGDRHAGTTRGSSYSPVGLADQLVCPSVMP